MLCYTARDVSESTGHGSGVKWVNNYFEWVTLVAARGLLIAFVCTWDMMVTTRVRHSVDAVGYGSRVMRVMGQLSDGSLWVIGHER